MDLGHDTSDVVKAIEENTSWLKGVYVTLIIFAAVMMLLTAANVAKADYSCSDLVRVTNSTWGERVAVASARKDLREKGDACLVESTAFYVEQIRKYCLWKNWGKTYSLEEAKAKALNDAITACNILREED